MFNHIVIPLDGSPLAEVAVERALAVAHKFESDITLVKVIEPVQFMFTDLPIPSAELLDDVRRQSYDDALNYLSKWKGELRQRGFKAQIRILRGDQIAPTLLDLIKDTEVDLVVMSTHGRTGLRRWVMGSVAEKVVRYSDKPVLLVRSSEHH